MVNQRTVADPGDARDAHLSPDPISFIFMQILANILPKNGWLPPGVDEPLWEILDSPLKRILKSTDYYRPQTKFAKVMFLNLSVSYSVHRGGSTWAGTPPLGRYTPWQVHPPGQVHLLAGTPPQAGTPHLGRYTPSGQVHPLGRYTPWVGTPPGQVYPLVGTLPRQVHPSRYTIQAGTPSRQVHPLPGQVHPLPGQVHLLPGQVHPPSSSACWEIWETSVRYASYWNAFLFSVIPANCCIRLIILGYQYRQIGVFVVGYKRKKRRNYTVPTYKNRFYFTCT